jgi:hypothetical protein
MPLHQICDASPATGLRLRRIFPACLLQIGNVRFGNEQVSIR